MGDLFDKTWVQMAISTTKKHVKVPVAFLDLAKIAVAFIE